MSLRSKTASERSHPNFDQLLWQAARRMVGLAANSPYSMSLRSKTANESGFGKKSSCA